MTATAVTFLILSAVLVWGGLIASTIHLVRRPEALSYPAGGHEDERPEHSVIVHDT